MTCIAFKSGIMAADTKATDDSGQIFKSQKLFKLPNGTILGTAGDSDARDVISLLSKASLIKLPPKKKLIETKCEFVGLWVFKTGEIFKVTIEQKNNEWTAEVLPILEQVAVAGSGGSYALGAMMAGKSAVDSVKIACKVDGACGLPVESLKLIDDK